MEVLKQALNPITSIEIFKINDFKPLHFSFGTWHNRQYAWLKITSGNHSGWAEYIASHDNPAFDMKAWGQDFSGLLNQTVAHAFESLVQKREVWATGKLEMAEMALLDLVGKLLGKSCIEILGLRGRNPVPGLYCILEEKPEALLAQIENAKKENLVSHVKMKIFGDSKKDTALIALARKSLGAKTFLTADANCGYDSSEPAALGSRIRLLLDAGLNACEDPARLSNEKWVELQKAVLPLVLIPDYNMRPAWAALEHVIPGMGKIYNLHPACMGSITDAIALGNKILSFGERVMIGDASLIGPACTAWQQIAIGLGAAWVEAIEKPSENDVIDKCTLKKATARNAEGMFALKTLLPGFGLELDCEKLTSLCDSHDSWA